MGHGSVEVLDRSKCLIDLLAVPNGAWTSIMAAAAASGGESLKQPETVRELTKFLKTSQRVCSAVGPLYVVELQVIFGDLMNVFSALSEFQRLMLEASGDAGSHHSLYKAMRSAKRETLKLLTCFVERCGEPEAPLASVTASLLPQLLAPTPAGVLGDYRRSIPTSRDPEVLTLFSTCIQKLPLGEFEGGTAVPRIMEAVFEPTLSMIMGNFEDFPETRLHFFQLLKAINLSSFPSLFAIPAASRKLVVDSVGFAIKHTERNVAETGLEILFEMLQNVERHPQASVRAQAAPSLFISSKKPDVSL